MTDTLFFKADELPRGLFKGCIIPRPIAWISTCSQEGILNLAPFSYFNAVADHPPMLMFATGDAHKEGGNKDTLKNAEETGEFVVNLVPYRSREAMNLTSADLGRHENEFEFAEVKSLPSTLVKPPRVAASPVSFECEVVQVIQLPIEGDSINKVMFGRVLAVHIDAKILVEGRVSLGAFDPIARLGYSDYVRLDGTHFQMERPKV